MVDIQPEDESISDTDMAELSGPSLKFDASMIWFHNIFLMFETWLIQIKRAI